MKKTAADPTASGRQRLLLAGSLLSCSVAGVLCGSLSVLFATTYAGLVFAGPLHEHIVIGIGMALFGAVVHAVVISTSSSYAGSFGGVCSEVAILAVVVSGVVAQADLGDSPQQRLATVVVTIALASATVGAVYMSLGQARLGNLIRYIPYPVMGGFIAGIGWLLLVGALRVSVGPMSGPDDLAAWLAMPLRWAPAAIVAAVLLVTQRRIGHYLAVPVTLALTAAGFFLTAWLKNVGIDELHAGGWLLGPFPQSGQWSPALLAQSVLDAQWWLLPEALPGIAAFTVTLVIGLLLVGASLEVVLERHVELNRELRVAGLSNLIAALAAGFPGYHYIGCTGLCHRMGAGRRLTGAVAAIVVVLTLLAGLELLEQMPRMVASVLLFFMALDLLLIWLVASFVRLTHTDYLIVLTVFSFVVFVGLMEGVVIGLILGIALFAFNYSRIDVVKKELTATTLRSRATRPPAAHRWLQRHGDAVIVYRLEGYIFFGTVNRLLERIRLRTAGEERPLLSVVLDFRNVRGLDSSAAIYFSRLPSLAHRHGFNLILVCVEPSLWRVLEHEGLRQERRLGLPGLEVVLERRKIATGSDRQRVLAFETLDGALEWAENRLLEESGFDPGSVTVRSLQDVNVQLFTDRHVAQRFMEYAQSKAFKPGAILIKQGAPFRYLYFVLSGTVTVSVDTEQGERVRLRSMGAGACIGEISMYLGVNATARVEAESHTEVISLSRRNLQRMRQEAPDIHARLHETLAHALASRLADSTRLIDILLH